MPLTSTSDLFNIFGVGITSAHLVLFALVIFLSRVTTRDKRYLNTYRALLREYKFKFDKNIEMLKAQNEFLTSCFVLLLDEKAEALNQRIKDRYKEINALIAKAPLDIEKALTRKIEEPDDPKNLIQSVREFFKKNRGEKT